MNKPKNNIEIVILQNGKIPKVNIEDKELSDLIKQSKINPKITTQKDTEFAQKINGSKAYKYKFDKFFSYSSSCKMQNVLANVDRYKFMYSDIALKISNE